MSEVNPNTYPQWSALLADAVSKPGLLLAAYSAFHNYSVGNQVLALAQCHGRGITPGPLATFPGWKEKGRHVRKGEKALTLCMPVTVKGKSDEGDDTTFTRFIYRPRWFVLAQTEGQDVEPEPEPGWDKAAALAALSVAEIPFDQTDGNTQGYAKGRSVAVSPLAALPHKTLFHELAHVVLGHTAEGATHDGEHTPRSLREAEAEAVALILCETLGLEGADYCRSYVQSWLSGAEIPERSAQKAGHVAAKVDYTYDQGGEFLQHQGEPVQHDGANYGPTFVVGRGLVTSVRRWDVTALHDVTKSVESRAGYNTAGLTILSRDPLGHQSTVSYADSFTDKAGTNTLAYPTQATDPDGYTSKVEYSFHTGLVGRAEDPKGAQQTFTYDAAGRTLRVEVSGRDATTNQAVSGGYTRWVYSDAMDAVQSWAQVDVGKPEVCSISILDGAGRTRATASDLPNSTGGYSATFASYDIAGRAAGQTNPTEVNGLWNPAGDDAARGWKWTTQTYDWKSRPLVTTLPKLLNPGQQGYDDESLVTHQVEYGGCGCAGGEVVTVKGELVPTYDSNAPAQARRTQKIHHDSLGRVVKTESMKWDGVTPESTTTTKYNALNQPVRARQYVGAAPQQEPEGEGSTYQTSKMTYDGHGRLKTRQLPEYAAGRVTTYDYSADDTVAGVTDPRGVVTTFSYNNRHLPTLAHYNASGATLPSGTPSNLKSVTDVTYSYDELGRRTGMTDGLGAMTYGFDPLGRLTSEKRTFNDLDNPSVNGVSKSITYAYATGGALKSVTVPGGKVVNYALDQAGRLTGVSGTNPAGATTQFATNIRYRAWGAVKSLGYGNNLNEAAGYDARLRPVTFSVSGTDPSSGAPVTLMNADYQYTADGAVRYARDLTDARFNRAYSYDHAGRLAEAYTGSEADAVVSGTTPTTVTGPYRNSYQYDTWGNLKVQTQRYWNRLPDTTTTPFDEHNRIQGWTYDPAGNTLFDDSLLYRYDAAGRAYEKVSDPDAPVPTTIVYDGDGKQAKLIERMVTRSGNTDVTQTYTMRSTVLGGVVVCDLDDQLQNYNTYVYAGGRMVAKWDNFGATWVNKDPLTGGRRDTAQSYLTSRAAHREEPDPFGINVGTQPPLRRRARGGR